jgi:WXG100 family type VII secretion target
MADLIGGHTVTMDATAAKFVHQAQEFDTALANITSAVSALLAEFWGAGSVGYSNAMAKWNTDAKAIVSDLESITSGLKGSSAALTDLDTQLASMFAGFGG